MRPRIKTQHHQPHKLSRQKQLSEKQRQSKESVSSSKSSQRCQCCRDKKYPDYLQERRLKRQALQRQKHSSLEGKQQARKIEIQELLRWSRAIEEQISEYEETPLKSSLGMKSVGMNQQLSRHLNMNSSKKKLKFEIEVEIDEEKYYRRFSTSQYACKILSEIGRIVDIHE